MRRLDDTSLMYASAAVKVREAKDRDTAVIERIVSAPDYAGALKAFGELVLRHYAHERSVSFYAEKLGITPAHLSTTVRQATGKTCGEVISSMIIMEAKTRLRETDLSIQEIAYSLNFPSLSFFGKYFKRHVGVGPLEYRNGK